MGQTKFFVRHDGANQGPFDRDTIQEKLSAGELKQTDEIYNEETDQWLALEAFFKMESATLAPNSDDIPDRNNQWYVLKGKNRYGPFTYLDVVRMLQEKSVFEFDYVWKDGLETWMRLAEVSEFHASKIKALLDDSEVKSEKIFHRRRHRRFQYECPLVAHDNSQVWKGKTVELSEGGAGIIMENAMILPGQNVYVHFKPGPTSKPFNVLCEVVSKKYEKGIKNKASSVIYGIKFINIHKQDSDEIKTMQVAA